MADARCLGLGGREGGLEPWAPGLSKERSVSNKRMELSPVVLESEGVCGLEFKDSLG